MSMTSTFTRRVSFNNLHPDYIDSDTPSPLKQNYAISFNGSSSSAPSFNNPFGTLDVNRMYSNTPVAAIPSGYIQKKKCTKLPDPPSKSILKNKLSQQQRIFNIENSKSLGINYHEDLNDLAAHPPTNVPKSELAYTTTDNAIDSDEDSDESESSSETEKPVRRKSYSGMTDEELMALDPQYQTTKSKVSNVDQFKFDSQTTYYLPSSASRKNSTNGGASGKNTVYPSSNENNYKSINLTVKHPDLDTIPNRTILTVISGRRHSWNSLDWLFNKTDKNGSSFLQNGDYLIVAALIPAKAISSQNKKSKKRGSSGSIYNPDTDGVLYKKCENLLNYLIENLPKELKLKITVEFVSDNTVDEAPAPSLIGQKKKLVRYKFLFSKLLAQYQPFIVVVGNKSSNLNFKYPVKVGRVASTPHSISGAAAPVSGLLQKPNGNLTINKNGSISNGSGNIVGVPGMGNGAGGHRPSIVSSTTKATGKDQYLIKLSSYMIKYFPVPVILVGNNTKPSFVPSNPSSVTFGATKITEERISKRKPMISEDRKNSSASTGSIESIESTVDTVEDVIAEEGNTEELAVQVENLYNSDSITRFQDMITLISDSSLTDSRSYLEQLHKCSTESSSGAESSIKFSPSVITNSKIHSIYNSSKQNQNKDEPMYKVKSMISMEEDSSSDSKKKLEKVKSNISTTTTASSSSKKEEEKSSKKSPQKKPSFWKKIGIKK